MRFKFVSASRRARLAALCLLAGGPAHAAQGEGGTGTAGLGAEVQLTQRSWLVAESYRQDRGKPQQQIGLRQWLVQPRTSGSHLWPSH
jgi:hypothetical protein